MKWTELAIIPLAAFLVAGLLYFAGSLPGPARPVAPGQAVPDFGAIQDVASKKRRFFEFMLPKVRNANQGVLNERRILIGLANKVDAGEPLTEAETRTLAAVRSRYHLAVGGSTKATLQRLLSRVDEVPASLMLAQSATESAWGTSRFARQGNNFFGVWCFTPGCGMTPKYRDEGLTHEVARFDTVQDSVDHYLLTINTNMAYRDLRQIRAGKRRRNKPLRGVELAEGLRRYSERGSNYVRDIQAMIRNNKLQRYTDRRSPQLSDNN